MKKYALLPFLAMIILGAGCPSTEQRVTVTDEASSSSAEGETVIDSSVMAPLAFPGVLPDEERLNKIARLKTDKGEIVIELYGDSAPKTVSNFIYLTNLTFYNLLTFHRREEGFVIQGGDPNGNGTGGPGYTFEDELDDDYTYERGMVAMANRGPDTNGSQFFIMLADYPLAKNYSIFGKVVEGMEVVDQIQVGDVMREVTIEEK